MQSGHLYNLIKCTLFSSWYSWQLAHMALNNNILRILFTKLHFVPVLVKLIKRSQSYLFWSNTYKLACSDQTNTKLPVLIKQIQSYLFWSNENKLTCSDRVFQSLMVVSQCRNFVFSRSDFFTEFINPFISSLPYSSTLREDPFLQWPRKPPAKYFCIT
jgi:hypothetical protein